MRTRRGFTLIELLLVVVVMGIIGTALTRVILNSFRVSASQLTQADMQANVRVAGLLMPLELREIGYDSNITTGVVTSDIEAIGQTAVRFRAWRGIGMTCGTPTLNEVRLYKPPMGSRLPRLSDGFLWFVENDPNLGTDDQWLPLDVTAVDENGLCGADPAIVITMNTPQVSPGGVNLALSNIKVGGPVRYYERMQFGTYVGADGRTWLGARSLSLGELSYQPVAGPLVAFNPVQLMYYNKNGVFMNPAAANPVDVRAIDIQIRGLTDQAITLAGTLPRRSNTMTLQTRVALRNTLSH